MPTIEERKAEIARLQAELAKEEGKAEAKKTIEEMMADLGYTHDELFGAVSAPSQSKGKGKGSRGPRNKPMYVHPDNGRLSWVGPERSKNMPDWLKKELANGKRLEDFPYKEDK